MSSKKNGHAAKKKADLEVGKSYQLNTDDGATARTALEKLETLHQLLGEKREAFLLEEMNIAQAVSKARHEYTTLLQTLGKKHGLNFEDGKQKYHFDQQKMVFTRTA